MRRRFAQLKTSMEMAHPEITDLGNVTGAVALE